MSAHKYGNRQAEGNFSVFFGLRSSGSGLALLQNRSWIVLAIAHHAE